MALELDVQEKFLDAIKCDDIKTVSSIIREYDTIKPIFNLTTAPKQLCKQPTFVNAAAYFGSVNCLKYFLRKTRLAISEDNRGRNAAHYAAYSSKIEVFHILYQYGISLDKESNNKKRPIHIAAKKGNLGILYYLWAQNCNLKKPDYRGFEPIHQAALSENFEALDFFLKAGVKLNIKLIHNTTLYILAIRHNKLRLLEYLIENKYPQVPNKQGNFPIHEAIKEKSIDIVRYLLQNGADPKCYNKKRTTPLHLAAKQGSDEIALLLLDSMNEIDVNPTDKHWLRPLHYAIKAKKISLVRLLLDYGAKYDSDFLTYAETFGTPEIYYTMKELQYEDNPNDDFEFRENIVYDDDYDDFYDEYDDEY